MTILARMAPNRVYLSTKATLWQPLLLLGHTISCILNEILTLAFLKE